MTVWLLEHSHEPGECGIAFAAWRGFHSPLRSQPGVGTCREGRHEIWWLVKASDEAAALEQVPRYVAERARVAPISRVSIP
jgi:hypothetical protein